MTKAAHTPTPWAHSYRERPDKMFAEEIYDKEGKEIASLAWYAVPQPDGSVTTNREANAAFIVRACNAHDDLVKALETLCNSTIDELRTERADAWCSARAALAKAKGGAA